MKRHTAAGRKTFKRRRKEVINLTYQRPMGLFTDLPEEIIQSILGEYIPLSSLAVLAQTSKSMCTYIRELAIDSQLIIQPICKYIVKNWCPRISVYFAHIGSFLRMASSYLNTKDKLRVLETFIFTLEESFIEISQKLSLEFAYDCIGLLIQRFVIKWDDDGLREVFTVISRLSKLHERLNRVLSVDNPGILRKFEQDIRLFVRLVFIEKVSSSDQHCLWLSLLMELFPTQRARLLFLLYGPTEEVEDEGSAIVDWYLLAQCTDYGHFICPYEILKDLADVFTLVSNSERFKWSETAIIRFFNEITCTPDEWCHENQAKLLFLLGQDMAVKILQAKLKTNNISDFAGIAYHLAQVSSPSSQESSPHSLTWFVEVVFKSILVLPAPSSRSYVIAEIFSTWKENIQSLTDDLQDNFILNDFGNLVERWRASVTNLSLLTHLLTEALLSDKPGSLISCKKLFQHDNGI
ncbi:F-box only protein 47-like [Bolinopsis microptera]|uniref:F-box only protein 47-like n=1 Tax=Bolinopsis microptera TaxID=2820187 RepID=UPI003079858A